MQPGKASARVGRAFSGPRIAPLDTLRGIAILMVIAAHFWPPLVLPPGPDAVMQSLGVGGVLLFFLLSGYLIYRNVQRQPLFVFLERRLFKLMPAYWLNVAAMLALGLVLPDSPPASLRTYLANFLMVPDLARTPLVNGVYWTLVIEIKFYLLIAVQNRFLGDRWRLCVPAAIAAVNLAFWMTTGRGSTLLTYLPVFYIGIEIYRAERDGWTRAGRLRVALVIVAIAGSLALFVTERPLANAAYILFDAALFMTVLSLGWQAGWLNYFGRISYSLYLFHTTIGYPMVLGLQRWGLAAPLGGALAAAASILVAHVLFRCVEEPGVRAGRRLETYRAAGKPLHFSGGV